METRNRFEKLFYAAFRIRMVEERIMDLYPYDKIQSPVHLSIGQEAVAVGTCESLAPTDLLFGTYRSHAFYLAKGGDLRAMFAELYGKSTGCCCGKGGSMHLAAPEVGFMGTSAVVASTIPHAAGAAFAAQFLGTGQVVVAVFGDGATDEGVYHESLNFAALHRLPMIFLVENNGLAVHSRVQARHAFSIVDHAATYGIPATCVTEGYDLIRVADSLASILQEVRAGKAPQLVEIATYRYREHVGVGEDFKAGYRDRADLVKWQELDSLVTRHDLREKYQPAIAEEIADAVKFAEDSPWPEPAQLLSDVR
jgi:pyruvate dehydrogenase E1 component alpha subunit